MLDPAPAATLSALLAARYTAPTGTDLGLIIHAPHFTPPRAATRLASHLNDNIAAARSAFPALRPATYPGATLILAGRDADVGASLVFAANVPTALVADALALPTGDRHAFGDLIEALLAAPPAPTRRTEWGEGGEATYRAIQGVIAANAVRLATIIAAARDWRDPRPTAHDVALGARIAQLYGAPPIDRAA